MQLQPEQLAAAAWPSSRGQPFPHFNYYKLGTGNTTSTKYGVPIYWWQYGITQYTANDP